MSTSFALTWDYRCPFARNANEHVVAALRAGADWDVEFIPFSLTQTHIEEGDPDVWDDPEKADTLLASEAGIVVRDRYPDRFLDAHVALFTARHDQGKDLRDPRVIAEALEAAGVDADAVLAEIDAGWPRATFRKAHTDAAEHYQVFGVPTFIADGRGVFVRLMERPNGDVDRARDTVQRVLDLLAWPALNEFKHTTISN